MCEAARQEMAKADEHPRALKTAPTTQEHIKKRSQRSQSFYRKKPQVMSSRTNSTRQHLGKARAAMEGSKLDHWTGDSTENWKLMATIGVG